MDVVKYLAAARGVKNFSLAGVELPLEVALEDDQMSPLLVAAAAANFSRCKLYGQESLFPWTITIENENQAALIDGTVVVPQETIVPKTVGLCFIDYELERLVMECRLAEGLDYTPDVIPMDSLVSRIASPEDEQRNVSNIKFDLGF